MKFKIQDYEVILLHWSENSIHSFKIVYINWDFNSDLYVPSILLTGLNICLNVLQMEPVGLKMGNCGCIGLDINKVYWHEIIAIGCQYLGRNVGM